MNKLITLNEFTEEIEDYVNESKNVERGLQLIFAYNDFLSQPIKEDMFIGENPLFPNFVKCTQKEATTKGIEKSFDNFGKDEFYVCIKYGHENKPSYVTSFHLKTVNDLVGKFEDYNSQHHVYGWNDVCRLGFPLTVCRFSSQILNKMTEQGKERYRNSATFNRVVQMLVRDIDPYEIIDHLCQMSDDQAKAFEQYIHRDTRPMVMS